MHFLTDRWRRIGARMYLALGFAVFLTLVSSGVGVYYFERSGDLNFRVQSESAPVLEAAWSASRDIERLRSLGIAAGADPVSIERVSIEQDGKSPASESTGDQSVESILARLDASLAVVNSAPELASDAMKVREASDVLAGVVDNLRLNRRQRLEAGAQEAELRSRLEEWSADGGSPASVLAVLSRALAADNQPVLDGLWDEFVTLSAGGPGTALEELGRSDRGAFAVRGRQVALQVRDLELGATLDEASQEAESAATLLVEGASQKSAAALEASTRSFDRGRVLLAVISVASVIAATLASWLWVGNGLVRRLSRLSERMRQMAGGDLEMPVPEVGRDEIGELAQALEVFRQQALEVQRLNLVEQLYGELQEANAELTRMQARLVAQEKLAALGELVSGVAHEISNPLNFVKNFSEGSLDLYGELSEMLDSYRGVMSEDDQALLDDLGQELKVSLDRVCSNGGRVLSIVDRMRGLGVVGGEPVPSDLNAVLRVSAQAACSAFETEWGDFPVQPVFDLDQSVGSVPLVANDFGEAMKNLVSNACYSLRLKWNSQDGGYLPSLVVSSRLVGDSVQVSIRDNGTGIADDVLDRIFNPFFSTRDGVLGAGLGLPVAADVVRRAGGDLSVDTEYGEYAEFRLSLPARESVATG